MTMGESKLINFRKERDGSHLWLLLSVFALFFFFFPSLLFRNAFAADGDPVQTIANPGNTTINVFDYWIRDKNGKSIAEGTDYGINEGQNFRFLRNTSGNQDYWNKWTGKQGAATQGIVKPLLVDGYPVLNCLGEPMWTAFARAEMRQALPICLT